MKKAGLLALALVLLLLIGCGQNKPVELPEFAPIDRIFTVDETLYAVRSAGSRAYISTESAGETLAYRLSALANGRYSDALWHEQSGRLFFSVGYKVYSSDQTGGNKHLVWKLPDGTRKDFVRVFAAGEDRLLIKGGYGQRNRIMGSNALYTYDSFEFFSLNVNTGEVLPLSSEIGMHRTLTPICAKGNTVWLLWQKGNLIASPVYVNQSQGTVPAYVLQLDLLTGEYKELGSFSVNGTVHSADGVVLDEQLYFMYDEGGVYTLPLSGGTVEILPLDTTNAPGMHLIKSMAEHEGNIYCLTWDSRSYPSSALCTWDPETGALMSFVTTDNTDTCDGFLVDGENYSLFSAYEIYCGTLP